MYMYINFLEGNWGSLVKRRLRCVSFTVVRNLKMVIMHVHVCIYIYIYNAVTIECRRKFFFSKVSRNRRCTVLRKRK